MFSSLLIFHLLLSSIFAQSSFDQDFEDDFPYYNQVPFTNFRCAEQQWPGYYSDDEASCQVFHICVRQHDTLEQYSFLCPNETVFSQELLVCVWADSFDCTSAPSLYYRNEGIFEYFDDADLDSHVSVSQERGFTSNTLSNAPEGRALDLTGLSLPAIGKSLESSFQSNKRQRINKVNQSPTGRQKDIEKNIVSPTVSSEDSRQVPTRFQVVTTESPKQQLFSNNPRDILGNKVNKSKPAFSQLKSTVSSNVKSKELIRDKVVVTKQKSAEKTATDISTITNKAATPILSTQKQINRVTSRKQTKSQNIPLSATTKQNKFGSDSKQISPKSKPSPQRPTKTPFIRPIKPTQRLQTPFTAKKISRVQSIKSDDIPSQLQAPSSKQITSGQNIRGKATFKEPKRSGTIATTTIPHKPARQFKESSVSQKSNVDFARKISDSRSSTKPVNRRTEKKEQKRKETTRKKLITTTAVPATPSPIRTTQKPFTKRFRPTVPSIVPKSQKLDKTGKQFQSTSTRGRSRTTSNTRKLSKPTPRRPTKKFPSRASSTGLTTFDILHDLLKNVTVLRSKALLKSGGTRGKIRRNRKADVTDSKISSNNQADYTVSKYTSSRGIPRISKKQNFKSNRRRVSNSNFAKASVEATKLYPNSKPSFQSQTSGQSPIATQRNRIKDTGYGETTCVYNSESNSFSGCQPLVASLPLKENENPNSYDKNTQANRLSQIAKENERNSQNVPTEVSKILNIPSIGSPVTLPNRYMSPNPSEPLKSNQISLLPNPSSSSRYEPSETPAPVLIVSRADAQSNEKNQKKVYVNRIESK